MSNGNSYDDVEALICDPVAANRAMGRAALYTLGFRRIEAVASIQDFTDGLRRIPRDLALCESQGRDVELCSMIQSLRQDATAYNPFIVIIATAWEKTSALVSRVVNSGADDLLLRPFSTELLGQHIEAHIERRKPFVVTADYVGPDRRNGDGRTSRVVSLDPPNSLRMKVMGRQNLELTTQRLNAELRTARGLLNSEKLRCEAFQIYVFSRMMQSDTPESTNYPDVMAKIGTLIKAVEKRSRETEFAVAVESCQPVLLALERLDHGGDRTPSLNLLVQSALKLLQVVGPEKPESEHFLEIDEAIAAIRAHNQHVRGVRDLDPSP